MIFDHHLPCAEGLAVPVAPASSSIDQHSALLALPVNVYTGVEWVLQEGNDVPVPDGLPREAGHPTFLGRSREVDPVSRHLKQYLAGTADYLESSEDEADHLLQTSVGIKTKPDISVPDVAEGDG